jgi:16S rRNA G966 N2-methylase RsmD
MPAKRSATPSLFEIHNDLDFGKTTKRTEAPTALYATPLPASRTGALYSAFSYPTKISPESIAVFVASHTQPGDTILDCFGGSGTTGLAALLAAKPTAKMKELATKLQVPVKWGPRKAVIYELSVLGSFVARTMCSPPSPSEFLKEAETMISACERKLPLLYAAVDNEGNEGWIRHAIWSDVLVCTNCGGETSFWDTAVTLAPAAIAQSFRCTTCGYAASIDEVQRVFETFWDPLTGRVAERKKRVLKRVYGESKGRKWSRPATADDDVILRKASEAPMPDCVPIAEIPWGDLYRSGYHKGITHLHHFYTPRNLLAMATIWEQIETAPPKLHDALKFLALSYNATHATLMTRVVVKQSEKDFVLTGAQSGVLYISGLPVEKNLFAGLRRKAKTIAQAFAEVAGSSSTVRVVCGDSSKLDLPNHSVSYIFSDPPFGDFIPYSELTFFNEIWLGKTTEKKHEIIVSAAQKKTVSDYSRLMEAVFREMARTLKDDGKATIVFHSAKAEVWTALQRAYKAAGFQVELSGLLDKLQGSFKQVTSSVSVKGDPLLLLTKNRDTRGPSSELEPNDVLAELLTFATTAEDHKERTPERLYSRFVARYLESGLPVPMDAAGFYSRARLLLEAL